MVRDNATIVVNDFKRVRGAINDVKKLIDKRISNATTDINTLADSIASLNQEITRLEVQGGETGDLRDQRDAAVGQLATYFKVKTYENERGQFTVNIDGAGSLVTGTSTVKIVVGGLTKDGLGAADDADIHMFFEGRRKFPITDYLKGGQLGAMVKTRNTEIAELYEEIDELAYGLAKSTNAIHRRGFVGREIQVDANGQPLEGQNVTGLDFFKEPLDLHQAANFIEIDDKIMNDLSNISTGLKPNAPGDNRVAMAISKLQHEKVLSGGQTTFEEQYLKSVGKIGLRAGKAKIDTEQTGGILAQAKTVKERLSGVSLDEETANMVRYQHAYDASARVIRTAGEMFDTVLGIMR
jgi:flagellar hook-associated protein 1 FlgK